MTNQSNHRGLAICYTAIFLLALNGLFSNSITLNAVTITQIRSVIAALALLAFCLLTRRQYRLATRRDFMIVYSIGIVMGLHWVTFFHSMQISSVAIGMLSLYTYPVITVLLEPFFSKQRLKTNDLLAATVVVIGIVIMAYEELDNIQSDFLWGIIWGVLSALLFSFRNIVQKYSLANVSSDNVMFHQLIAIAVMLVWFIDFPAVARLDTSNILLLIGLGVVTTAGAHTLLLMSIKSLPVKTVAMIGCTQPVIGAFFAWLILHETITIYIAIGGTIVLIVALYESLKKAV